LDLVELSLDQNPANLAHLASSLIRKAPRLAKGVQKAKLHLKAVKLRVLFVMQGFFLLLLVPSFANHVDQVSIKVNPVHFRAIPVSQDHFKKIVVKLNVTSANQEQHNPMLNKRPACLADPVPMLPTRVPKFVWNAEQESILTLKLTNVNLAKLAFIIQRPAREFV